MARDPDLDYLKALRILAFRAVEKRDHEYVVRHVCRWYSERFHTPLGEVEAIPLEQVLTHFFEVQVEEMDDEARDELRALLCETRAERLRREADEEAKAVDDAAFEAMVMEESRRQQGKGALPKPDDGPIVPPLPVMGQPLPAVFPDSEPLRPMPPDIKMTFVSEGELEDLDKWDLLGPPAPKKRK